ncbi:putative WD repeat-containing protein C2A9.03 [Glycine max]|nr:putative WD repeat-containing protein C2A9.03 [Glycine max]
MKRKPFALGGSQSYEAPLYFPYKYMSTSHSPSQSFWLTMEHFNNDDLEYIVHFQDDFPTTDTTCSEARNGKDIQGIPWERLNYSRDKYRETRLKQYKNYQNFSLSPHHLHKECFQVQKGQTFYDFFFNTRLVKSTIVHFQVKTSFILACYVVDSGTFGRIGVIHLGCYAFYCYMSDKTVSCQFYGYGCIKAMLLKQVEYEQLGRTLYYEYLSLITLLYLRNLLWATSKHDVYLMQNYSVMHWSALLQRSKEVLNVAKPIIPTLTHPGFLAQPVSRVQISTMTVKENLMVAGGFQGELICKNLKQPGVLFCGKITTDGNAITNAVDVYRNPAGSLRVITANNDSQLRVFDAENFASLGCFKYDWSVNNTSISPDGRLLAVLGDSTECLMADANSGKITGSLKGHLDYSFSSAWHPNGQILATGNQDKTCRLWDIRNLSQSMAVLKGRMGAIRALRFTSDGRFLAMAEPADFVHIFDSHSGYEQGQEIDLFGEIAGISFSPDTEALFVGIADRTYGSLLEFNRKRHYNYLDSF